MQKFLFLTLFLFSFALRAETIVLTNQNTASLNVSVNTKSMSDLIVKIDELNAMETSDPIYLVIKSPGGEVEVGFDFIRYVQSSRRPIHTITIFAASMAFNIVEALGNRYVTVFSTLMSHKSSGGMGGTMPGSMDTRYSHYLSQVKEMEVKVIKRTKGKQTLQSYAKLIQDEYWANSEKAIRDGFADKEVEVVCSKSLNGNHAGIVESERGELAVTFSDCPMNTFPIFNK